MCEAPGSLAYLDVATTQGLNGLANPGGDHLNGAGAGVADFDLDGDLDVLLAYSGKPLTLFRRNEDQFVPETIVIRGIHDTGTVALFDIDGDGDLDALVGGATAGSTFLRNTTAEGGEATLVEEPLFLPSELPRDAVYGAASGDPDADGDVDLYVPLYAQAVPARVDRLLVNDAGTFAVGPELPPTEGAKTYQALWFDADGDGDVDAYATNDQGSFAGGNALFLNDDGVLSASSSTCAPVTSGMSADTADVNGDGLADLYLGNSDFGNLYYADGSGGFYDVAPALGALNATAEGDHDMVWGVALLDAENDGDLDLFAAHGDLYALADPGSEPFDAADSLLLQGDDGTFTEAARALGLDSLDSGRAVVPADFNGDGVLDLLVTGAVTEPHLWESSGCTEGAWLDVNLVGTTDNLFGLGARVEVVAGGRTFTAWVSSSASLFASRAPTVHFGLGDAATVERLTVTWPSGATQSTDFKFAPRRALTITQE